MAISIERNQLAFEAVDSLVVASFSVIALLSRIAAENELSLTQLRVLAILRDRRPMMAELANYLGLERSSVSGLVDRAVRRDLVRRDSRDDDGRAVQVCLTPRGRQLAEAVTEEIGTLLAPMTQGLSAVEVRRLILLLNRVSP